MWQDKSIFYHIYPLGFCGCEDRNDFSYSTQNRLNKITDLTEHIKNLGANALYLGPVFQSTAHGYDTADYFHIDKRLGTNEDFKNVCQNLHDNGLKIVLDGVFNHVGRDFWAFKDVKENKGYSKFVNWFSIKWNCNNHYNDGFCYDDWEGCSDLVKLNLKNPEVKNHIFEAIRTWVENYNIDGLRLDVAYCLDKEFLKELHNFCKNLKSDFWLMGETLHGDYNQWMNPEMLDSVTNYECYKGLFSSFNDKNMFEIAYSFNRQDSLYKGKLMYNFLDNHDVDRISTSLKDKNDLKLLYTMLFSMSGIPSIYYGSEWGIEGDKGRHGDKVLRPNCKNPNWNDLTDHIQHLCQIRNQHEAFVYGSYKQLQLTNEAFTFARETENDNIVCGINISNHDFILKYNGFEAVLPPKSAHIFAHGSCLVSIKADTFAYC